MSYTKPEVLVLGDAAEAIQGKDPDANQDGSHKTSLAYDLDE